MINRIRENFTQIDNHILNTKELSLKAKGLYAFLCSKPDNWKFNYAGLSKQLQEGEKAIRNAVKELVNFGVLLRYSKKENNDFNGWEWIINPSEEDLKKYTDPTKTLHYRSLPKGQVPYKASSQKGKEISNNDLSNTNLSNNNNYKELSKQSFVSDKELYFEASEFLRKWNKLFGKNYMLTEDFKNSYKTCRNKYSKEEIEIGTSNYYRDKISKWTKEERKKFELHILKFIRQKNGLPNYL